MSFKDKTVWITGASSGIGEEMAYAFAKEGASLILSARRKEKLEAVKANCIDSSKVMILTVDLTKEAEIPTKMQEALSFTGQIDVLVNNGGISQRAKIADTDMEVYRRLMEVNYFGTVAITKAVLPHFVKRKTGHFVVTSSLMGKFSSPMRSGYAAAKHALHGFFESLRAEYYDDNIHVTMVCPGFIRTDISLNSLSGEGNKHGKMDDRQANGVSAAECARKIVKAVRKKKAETYIGRSEIMAIYLKRFFPSLLNRIVRKAKVT